MSETIEREFRSKDGETAVFGCTIAKHDGQIQVNMDVCRLNAEGKDEQGVDFSLTEEDFTNLIEYLVSVRNVVQNDTK